MWFKNQMSKGNATFERLVRQAEIQLSVSIFIICAVDADGTPLRQILSRGVAATTILRARTLDTPRHRNRLLTTGVIERGDATTAASLDEVLRVTNRPPVWTWRGGDREKKHPGRGRRCAQRFLLERRAAESLVLIMEYQGNDYTGCVLLDDRVFARSFIGCWQRTAVRAGNILGDLDVDPLL